MPDMTDKKLQDIFNQLAYYETMAEMDEIIAKVEALNGAEQWAFAKEFDLQMNDELNAMSVNEIDMIYSLAIMAATIGDDSANDKAMDDFAGEFKMAAKAYAILGKDASPYLTEFAESYNKMSDADKNSAKALLTAGTQTMKNHKR